MKFRKYSFLFVCVFFFALLTLCASEEEVGNKGQDKWKTLVKHVEKDNSDLIGLFAEKKFDKMTKLYVKRGGVIVTPQGERFHQEKHIIDFWTEHWREGAKLEFRIKTINIKDIGKKEIEKQKLDALAFVVNEFRIIVEKGGSILQNEEGDDERDYLHREVCPWF